MPLPRTNIVCNMSIAIISETRLLSSNNAAATRVWNYAQALHMVGERVLLLSLADYQQGSNLQELESGIKSYGQAGKNRGTKAFLKELTRLVREEQITSILFYPTPNPLFELRFLRWKRKHKFANVYCEVNEVRRFEQTYVKTFSLPKLIAYKLVTANSEKITRSYRGLVCISENIRQYFESYNSHSLVVPILSDMPKRMPKHRGNNSGTVRFVFTGTVGIEKENLVELFRGFYAFDKTCSDWEFLLYGQVPEANRARIENILEILGLTEKVKLMGPINHERVARVLSEADCLILPRRNTKQNYYGFSTKLSEYAVSGTPIILTDTGVVFRYFEDGRDCMRVEGYEAQGFCEQMKRFIRLTAEERNEMACHAFETASKHFDWRMYAQELKQFLTQN